VSIVSLQAQTPTKLVGQNWLGRRARVERLVKVDTLALRFGQEPTVTVTAQFNLTHGRFDDPRTGTMELVVLQGHDDQAASIPLARKPLTLDEFAALGTSEVIKVEELNIELELVDAQRQAIAQQ